MWLMRLLWWRPPFVLRAVIVNLKSDHATVIKGLLWSVRGPWFTFVEAQLLRADTDPVRIDGQLVVHRDDIAYTQVLP